MDYRIHPKTGDKISVIGIGTGPIFEASEQDAVKALCFGYEQGVNYVDFATAGAKTFTYAGEAFASVRKDMLYQIHFGANYDYGFIHCQDEDADWAKFRDGGALSCLLELKRAGVVKHIGLSSHTPALAGKILDSGLVDQLMFSINPAYDYQHGEFAFGSASERMQLYRRCEAEKIGISVMKPFSAGQLLDARTSPFGKALTKAQCIQYALDKPGVLTVLPGIRGLEDMKEALAFLDASPEERDYSVIGTFTPQDMTGTCVYCSHCQPCPAGLDIALINKYYDLALAGDALAADHYAKLERKASACIGCGHCDRRCPFHVKQADRMREIAAHFGA